MGGLNRCGHFYGGYMHGLGILKGGQNFAAFSREIEGPSPLRMFLIPSLTNALYKPVKVNWYIWTLLSISEKCP